MYMCTLEHVNGVYDAHMCKTWKGGQNIWFDLILGIMCLTSQNVDEQR